MWLLTLPPRWEASKEHMPFGVRDMASFLPVVGDIFQRELAKQLHLLPHRHSYPPCSGHENLYQFSRMGAPPPPSR